MRLTSLVSAAGLCLLLAAPTAMAEGFGSQIKKKNPSTSANAAASKVAAAAKAGKAAPKAAATPDAATPAQSPQDKAAQKAKIVAAASKIKASGPGPKKTGLVGVQKPKPGAP